MKLSRRLLDCGSFNTGVLEPTEGGYRIVFLLLPSV